jgi:hypothetical protein
VGFRSIFLPKKYLKASGFFSGAGWVSAGGGEAGGAP